MGVDVPQSGVRAVLKEHAKWQQQQETPEYLNYKYIIYFSTDIRLPALYNIMPAIDHATIERKPIFIAAFV